jgi:putative glutamine amidotransferase
MTSQRINLILTFLIILGGITLAVLYSGCEKSEPGQGPLRIALSKGYPADQYENYYKWVQALDSSAECIDMYNMPIDSALELFRSCSGLLLTGGGDIDPVLYGKPEERERCYAIDPKRDELEMRLVDSAIAWNKPILGICRGHQLINVALGGTLIVDIPADYGTIVSHRCADPASCTHTVLIKEESFLFHIAGHLFSGETNSSHHQAIDKLGQGLTFTARTTDSLIEAAEWEDPKGKPFLLSVQWHPEKMDIGNPLSGEIGRRFLRECRE